MFSLRNILHMLIFFVFCGCVAMEKDDGVDLPSPSAIWCEQMRSRCVEAQHISSLIELEAHVDATREMCDFIGKNIHGFSCNADAQTAYACYMVAVAARFFYLIYPELIVSDMPDFAIDTRAACASHIPGRHDVGTKFRRTIILTDIVDRWHVA